MYNSPRFPFRVPAMRVTSSAASTSYVIMTVLSVKLISAVFKTE